LGAPKGFSVSRPRVPDGVRLFDQDDGNNFYTIKDDLAGFSAA